MPVLTVDKKQYNIKRLANGAFARIYKEQASDRVFALVESDSGDYTKEAIAMFADLDNPHIPKIERENTGSLSSLPGLLFDVYTMPFYRRPKGRALRTAKWLINAWQNFSYAYTDDDYQICADFLQSIRGFLDSRVYDALGSILYATSNYGRMRWDFHIGNFAQDNRGQIILLDVMFQLDAKRI